MVQHRRFMDMAVDDKGLHTPDGVLDLALMTRADVIRNQVRQHSAETSEDYGSGALGGAILGGAIAGPIGAVGGGLLGAAVQRDHPSEEFPRTVSATLIFESPALAYSVTVPVDRVQEAVAFVALVKGAAGL